MRRYKKILLFIAGVFMVILVTLNFLAPRIINSASVREKIVTAASQKLGGKVAFKEIDLAFFPRPRADIHQGTVSIPEKAEGTLKSLSVYPRILPLLMGELQIARIRIQSPDITVTVPERSSTEKRYDDKTGLDITHIEEEVAALFAPIAAGVPRLDIIIKEGILDIIEAGHPVFSFGDIDARISFLPREFEITITGNSNIWKAISLKGSLKPEDLKGQGTVELTEFRPQVLTDYLFPHHDQYIGDSGINIKLAFEVDGLNEIQTRVTGSAPDVTLYRQGKKAVIKVDRIDATVQIQGDTRTIDLSELNLGYPELNLTGQLRMDTGTPEFSLELDGSNVDVPSTREAALSLAGDIPVIQKIFEIVKGGSVPDIVFTSEGASLNDLGKTENFSIHGRMEEGDIFVPGVELDLEAVYGDAVISEGILQGENLKARLENSQGHDGALRLGLQGTDAPFHLDIMVEADLKQVPPILRRTVKNEAFVKEVSNIRIIEGTATGRLVLGESLKHVRSDVYISEISLSADYERIPYPLKIDGGTYSYDENGISFEDLSGTLESSSFSGLSSRLDFREDPDIKISSGTMRIFLDEIYPWLLSYGNIADELKNFTSAKGILTLTDLNLEGPLLNPEQWDFSAAGEAENLIMETALFPDSVSIAKGRLRADHERLVLEEAQTRMLDANLDLSASLHGYLKGLRKADVSFQGDMGSRATQWLSRLIKLPDEITVRAPLTFKDAQLSWNRDAETAFHGNMVIQDARIVLDMSKSTEELLIKNLSIEDGESLLSAGLLLRGDSLDITFDGELTKKTIEKIISSEIIQSGWIRGDFSAGIRLDKPVLSTARGRLEGEDLLSPLKGEVPLRIDSFLLHVSDDAITVDSARVTLGDNHLSVKGDIAASEEHFLVDMDVDADGIDWENVKKTFFKKDKDAAKGDEEAEKLPVQGELRLRSKYVTFEKFRWMPFDAAISIDEEQVQIRVEETSVCGISTSGDIAIAHNVIEFDMKLLSEKQPVEPTMNCLSDEKMRVTGFFDLEGHVMARGTTDELKKSLSGNLKISADSGAFQSDYVLDRTFDFLNETENLEEEFPDISKEAFSYNFIKAEGDFREGSLLLKEVIINSSTHQIAGQGEVDLFNRTMDLNLLVAPLKTVDSIVKKIPVLRGVTGGTVISIPVKVKGDFDDPKVSYLSASAIGSGLLRAMQGTLLMPVKIFQPIIPGGNIQ